MNRRWKISTGIIGVIAILLVAEPTSAQIVTQDIRDGKVGLNDISKILVDIIRFAIVFAGAVAAISIVVNGYQYILAAGNPEKLEKAKMGLTWSITGFILAASSFAIVLLLQTTLRAKEGVRSSDLFRGPGQASTVVEQLAGTLLLFGGAAGILFLILGGYRLITSQGNPEQIDKAKKTLLYTAIGMGLLFLAVVLVRTIVGYLKN